MAVASVNRTADPILALAIEGNSSPENYPAPPFQLTDQNGQPVSLASLRGKVVLMTFLDPVCTNGCPIIGAEFKEAGVLLGSADKDVELVAVVANPTYRSVAFTQAFDREEGLNTVPNWLYLTGSLQPAQPGLAAVRRRRGDPARGRDDRPQLTGPGHRPDRAHPRGVGRRPRARHDQHPVLVLRAAHPVRPPGAE